MLFSDFAFAAIVPLILALPLEKKDGNTYNVKSCQLFYDSPYAAFSCQATRAIPSTYKCCYESVNGVVLHTQFWDYDEVENAAAQTKFTIHGLWNDRCDGSYQQYCDTSLEVKASNLDNLIGTQFNNAALLKTMKTYWLNNAGSLESLWEHEYNKHGTCFNTLSTSCYNSGYKTGEVAYDFYRKVVEVWQSRPTYDWLSDAGIVPSQDQTYALSDIEDALSQQHGAAVYVGCKDSNAINQIYYTYNVEGNILSGRYQSVDSLTSSNCPSNVRYLPKGN